MVFAIFTVTKCVCTEGAKAMVSKVIRALCAFQCNDRKSVVLALTHTHAHTHAQTYTHIHIHTHVHAHALKHTYIQFYLWIHLMKMRKNSQSYWIFILVYTCFYASVKYEVHMNLFSFTFLYNSGPGEGHQCDWGIDWPNYICYGKIFSCGGRIIIRYLVDSFLDMNTMWLSF